MSIWRERALWACIGVAASPVLWVIWKASIYFFAGVAVVLCGPGPAS